jgi:hypothetical protein
MCVVHRASISRLGTGFVNQYSYLYSNQPACRSKKLYLGIGCSSAVIVKYKNPLTTDPCRYGECDFGIQHGGPGARVHHEATDFILDSSSPKLEFHGGARMGLQYDVWNGRFAGGY